MPLLFTVRHPSADRLVLHGGYDWRLLLPGLLLLVSAYWLLQDAPVTTVSLDRSTQTYAVGQRSLSGAWQTSGPLAQVAHVEHAKAPAATRRGGTVMQPIAFAHFGPKAFVVNDRQASAIDGFLDDPSRTSLHDQDLPWPAIGTSGLACAVGGLCLWMGLTRRVLELDKAAGTARCTTSTPGFRREASRPLAELRTRAEPFQLRLGWPDGGYTFWMPGDSFDVLERVNRFLDPDGKPAPRTFQRIRWSPGLIGAIAVIFGIFFYLMYLAHM